MWAVCAFFKTCEPLPESGSAASLGYEAAVYALGGATHLVPNLGAPSPSGAYDYQHQPEAQTRLEARGTQLNWITASEEMVQDSGRADSCRSEVQQAPSPSGA